MIITVRTLRYRKWCAYLAYECTTQSDQSCHRKLLHVSEKKKKKEVFHACYNCVFLIETKYWLSISNLLLKISLQNLNMHPSNICADIVFGGDKGRTRIHDETTKNRTRVWKKNILLHFFPDASQTFPTINKAHNKIKQTPKCVPYCLLWCNTWNKYLRFIAYLPTHGLFPCLKLKEVLKDVKSCMTPSLHLRNWMYFLQGQDVAGTCYLPSTQYFLQANPGTGEAGCNP